MGSLRRQGNAVGAARRLDPSFLPPTLPRPTERLSLNVHLPRPLPLLALAALLLGALGSSEAAADDPPAPPAPPTGRSDDGPLPAGVVARVHGRDVTRAEFHRHLADRLRGELEDPKSGPTTTLKMTIEEVVVEQEAKRLGISVTKDDLDRRYAEIDGALRQKSGGKMTLADAMKTTGTSPEEFRRNLGVQVTKERIAGHPTYLGDRLPKDENARLAQIEVVMGQILSRAKVEREGLPPGVVARVNGQPMTDEDFGRAIDLRMRTAEYLGQYVASILLKDLPIDDAALERSLARDRAFWERVRLLDPRPEMQTLSYENSLLLKHRRPIDELRRDPYFRGLRALEDKVRAEISDDDVAKEWVANAKTRYGPTMQILDVQVSFRIPNAVIEPVKRRAREEAQRIVVDYARRLKGGEPAQAILQEIQARRTPDGRPDGSVQAVRRTIRDVDNDLLVFQAAERLKDGEWSEPFETISEWHLVRRERFTPAPTFEEAREQVLQDLVVQRAKVWLQKQMGDRSVVRIGAK